MQKNWEWKTMNSMKRLKFEPRVYFHTYTVKVNYKRSWSLPTGRAVIPGGRGISIEGVDPPNIFGQKFLIIFAVCYKW